MVNLTSDSAAIFSPSVARIAASTARDWSYVDSWLASFLPFKSIPPFERNHETLKALLALAAVNEEAVEDRSLLHQAESNALHQCKEIDAANENQSKNFAQTATTGQLREGILDALEEELSKEGESGLEALAYSALALGVAHPDADTIGRQMLSLQMSIFEIEQMQSRLDILQRHLDSQLAENESFLSDLQSDVLQPSADLPKQNLDMQRRIKVAVAQMPDLHGRVASLAAAVDMKHPTINGLASEEAEYLNLLSRKKELEAQLAQFQGLPSDPDQAREELETFRQQLRGVTSRRDEVFEGLVEQASPVRKRR